MRPERDILLLCARPGPAGARRAALDALAPGPGLIELATRHEVMPLLARALGSAALDAETAAEVGVRCAAITERNRVWAGELVRIVTALERAGVRPLAFKGPALAQQAYGDLSLRTFDDLDLLVERSEIGAVADVLGALGWLPDVAREHLAAISARGRGPLPTEITFGSFGDLPDIDVHVALLPRYLAMRLDEPGIRERAVDVPIAGGRLRGLAPDDLLLYLCANGLKDAWTHLRAIADVAHLLSAAPPADPEGLLRRARRDGLERVLQLGVGLAARLLGAPVPPGMEAGPAEGLVAQLAAHWEDQPYDERPLARVALQLRVRERWRDRLACFAALPGDVTVRDLAVLRLPPPLYPLYYAIRPLRLAGKYLGKDG